MKFCKPLALSAALAAASAAPAAWAQEATTTFDVLITIESTCTIDTPAPTDVDFGTVDSSATGIQAEGTLFVYCTPDTEFNIALGSGVNGGDVTSRAMSNDDGVLVPYQLYQDPARSLVWGETEGTNTVVGTGTPDVQELTVYGLVPSANFPAGSYTDTVTATVIW